MTHQPSDFFDGVLVRREFRSSKWLPSIGAGCTLLIRLTEYDNERRHAVCVGHEDDKAVYRLIKNDDDTFESYKAWLMDIPHSAHARARKSALIRQAYLDLCGVEI